MMPDRPSIDHRLFLREESLLDGWAALAVASRRLDARLAAEAAARDLPITAARILLLLAAREGLDGKRIGRLLARPRATVAPCVALLVRRGLVERRVARDDRRRRSLHPTPEGRRAAQRIFRRLAPVMAAAYRRAGAGSVDGFRRVLDALAPEPSPVAAGDDATKAGSSRTASRS